MREKKGRHLTAALAAAVLAALLLSGCGRANGEKNRAAAVKMADFILSLQQKDGAIPDTADAESVNEDSNMEYALMALAAAYRSTGEEKYRSGLERGIAWLADAEVVEDGKWNGSWWYRYGRNGIPLHGPGDVRGVDTTSALFVYLLYLDQEYTGSGALAERYQANAAAALEFVLTENRTEEGFFASSFRRDEGDNWSRYEVCYSADQGDVWLGLQAGALLYGKDEYRQAADFLRKNVPPVFFSERERRYCTGIEDGRPDWSEQGFDSIQSQGFLPWMWGKTRENKASVRWLRARAAENHPQEYFLTAAFLGLGETGIGGALFEKECARLIENGLDNATGGVYDTPRDHTESVNTAAFCVLALLASPTGF